MAAASARQWLGLAAGVAVGIAATLVVLTLAGFRPDGRDSGESAGPSRAQAKTGRRFYTLRDGDVILRREAATRCEASGEGGRPNLFCSRIGGSRHDVVFYEDSVLVWPHSRGPDGPPFAYEWEPK